MNIGVKWDSYTSEAEERRLRAEAELISDQNVAAHLARDAVHTNLNAWVDGFGKDALREGRITKSQYISMCDRLSVVITDFCMDIIPAPEE